MAVYALDSDADGEKKILILIEVYCHYGITLFGCLSDGSKAITFVKCDSSFGIFETDNLIAWQWMATGATLILHDRAVRKEATQTTLCLVCQHVVNPIRLWHGIISRSYFYTVTTMQNRLH